MSTEFNRSYTLVCISPNGKEKTYSFQKFANAEAMANELKEKYAADDYEIYEVHKKLVWPLTS